MPERWRRRSRPPRRRRKPIHDRCCSGSIARPATARASRSISGFGIWWTSAHFLAGSWEWSDTRQGSRAEGRIGGKRAEVRNALTLIILVLIKQLASARPFLPSALCLLPSVAALCPVPSSGSFRGPKEHVRRRQQHPAKALRIVLGQSLDERPHGGGRFW